MFRLNDQVNRAANLLLNRLGLNRAGRDLISMGVPAANNFIACVTLINKELQKKFPKPRKEWRTEEFEEAVTALEDILNTLTRRYKGLLNDKAKGVRTPSSFVPVGTAHLRLIRVERQRPVTGANQLF